MRWTPQQDQFLRDNYRVRPSTQLARTLGVSQSSLRSRARKLSLGGTKPGRPRKTVDSQPPQPDLTAPQATSEPTAHLAAPDNSVADRYWTPEQDAVIREWYRQKPAHEIAAIIGKSKMAVTGRASRLHLTGTQRGLEGSVARLVINGKAPPPKLIPLTRTCVFIKGQRPYGDSPWCGAPVRPPMDDGKASPYCAEHHARCYQKHVLKGRKVPVRDVDGGVFR